MEFNDFIPFDLATHKFICIYLYLIPSEFFFLFLILFRMHILHFFFTAKQKKTEKCIDILLKLNERTSEKEEKQRRNINIKIININKIKN